jgi:predicted nucleic acid-binding protein
MTNGGPIYLDANVFIDFIEGDETISNSIEPLVHKLRQQPGRAITSELTLAEVLAPSKGRKRPPHIKRLYLNLLVWGRFIDLHPISRGVLYETAKLRATKATSRMKLLDAIHVATAILSGCRFFITRDRDIRVPQGMHCMAPDAGSVAKVIEALE